MADTLKVVAKEKSVQSGVRNAEQIADALSAVLADTYRLVFKTHAYHWNVEGPLFYGIHNLTEEQYENMFDAADELAERMRALGQLAPMKISAIVKNSVIEDHEGILDAKTMVEDLATDHLRVAHRLHALAKLASDNNDMVTEDLATGRSAFHEKAAWMLRAIATK